MAQDTQGLTNHKKRQNALERLDELEKAVGSIETYLKNLFSHMQKSFGEIQDENRLNSNILEALADVLGRGVVEDKLKERHIEKLEKETVALQEALDKQVEDGNFRAIETVKEDACLVVASNTGPDGKVLYPTKVFNDISEYLESVKKELVGKTVGATIKAEDGTVVTVLGIYERVEKEQP